MNFPTKVGAVALALVAAWAGGTVVTGQRIQTRLATLGPMGEPLEGGLFKVVNTDYRKSFFGATRTLTLDLGCAGEGQAPTRITVQEDIQHGPFPGFRSVGAARIVTTLVLDSNAKAALKQAIGTEELPLTVETLVGFGGGTRSTVSTPGLQVAQQGTQVVLKPGRMVVATSGGETQVTYELQGYAVNDGRGTVLSLDGLRGESRGAGEHWYTMSQQARASIDRIAMSTPQSGGQPMLTLTELQGTSTGGLQGELYSATSSFTGKGEVMGHKLDAIGMKASMKNLHAPSYAALMKSLFQPKLGCAGPEAAAAVMAQLEAMKTGLQGLLPHNPAFSLDELSVTFDGQTASLSYSLATDGMTPADIAGGISPALLAKVALKAEVKTTMGFLQAVAKVQQQAPEMVEAMVNDVAAKGMVTREGDQIRAAFSLTQGQALLNGKPMPLPGLPAPAQPPAEPEGDDAAR